MDSGPIVPAGSHILREVRSSFSSDPGRAGAGFSAISVTAHESALRDYLRVLDKRKWVVLSCLLIIPALVGIASLRMTKLYDAVGSIAINKVDPVSLSVSGTSGPADYFDPTDMDTEVQILESDTLALEVIRQLNLDKRPDFGGVPASAQNHGSITMDPLTADSARVTSMLGRFRGGLHVSVRPNTRIIEIHYTSPDKALAASVVNTLATTYKEENYKTKFESTMQASDWLSKQLVDLQIKVETSQEKLVRYQKEHEILGTDEKSNIITSKLEELNRELTAAEGDRMQKEAAYRQVQSGDPAAAIAPGTSGIIGGSQLDRLRGQQADLRIRVAEASTQLGPSYPKVAELNNQLKQIDTEIQNETTKVIHGIRDQYEVALQHEKLLATDFEAQKQQANKLNESAIEYSMLKRDLDTSRQLYEGLLEKMKEAGVTAGLRSNIFRIVNTARIPTAPSEPNIPRNLAFAFALALTSGVGLAFLLESLDNTVRTTEQAQNISQLPSLGLIPMGTRSDDGKISRRLTLASSIAPSKEAVELITQAKPQSQMAEAYRALRTSLLLSSLGAPPKIILVTSALPQEGKTTTSINTAVVLAQKGVRILLIDADMRRPSVHKTLGMTGPLKGLSNVLTGTATIQEAIVPSPQLPNLMVLPSGSPPPNPAELLASANMRTMLAQLREQYDHIVIDTPPTLSVTDAVVLSTRADAVVLVIRSGQTTKTALRRARDLLTQVNARICGVLLNAVDLASPDYYYYYEYQAKYGGHYYRGEEAVEETAPTSGAV